MKYYSTIISFLLLAVLTVHISGCGGGGGDAAPAEEEQLEKISGTWDLQSATLGAGDSWNDEFEGATLTLSGDYEKGGTYDYAFSVTPWPVNSPWPEDGNWKFKGTSGSDLKTKIVRLDDGTEISYTLTETTLTLTFPYSGDGFPDGKVSSVEGNWTFVFTK